MCSSSSRISYTCSYGSRICVKWYRNRRMSFLGQPDRGRGQTVTNRPNNGQIETDLAEQQRNELFEEIKALEVQNTLNEVNSDDGVTATEGPSTKFSKLTIDIPDEVEDTTQDQQKTIEVEQTLEINESHDEPETETDEVNAKAQNYVRKLTTEIEVVEQKSLSSDDMSIEKARGDIVSQKSDNNSPSNHSNTHDEQDIIEPQIVETVVAEPSEDAKLIVSYLVSLIEDNVVDTLASKYGVASEASSEESPRNLEEPKIEVLPAQNEKPNTSPRRRNYFINRRDETEPDKIVNAFNRDEDERIRNLRIDILHQSESLASKLAKRRRQKGVIGHGKRMSL